MISRKLSQPIDAHRALDEADGVSEPLLEEFARRDVAALFETVPRQIPGSPRFINTGRNGYRRIWLCLKLLRHFETNVFFFFN